MLWLGGGVATAADASAPPASPAPRRPAVKVVGQTQTFVAWNNVTGPGAGVPGLAATYDMPLGEFNWGGKQSTFNGAGVTTNSNYPIIDGEAVSHHTRLGLQAAWPSGVEVGALWQLYAIAGNRLVGRVFGQELLWDNTDRQTSTSVVQEHVATDAFQAWVKDGQGALTYHALFGDFIPELTRKETNFLRLGGVLYRQPVGNASYFEKEEHKLKSGRHPLRGFDVILDWLYDERHHIHGEVFTGRTKPTPILEINQDVVGTRWGVDVADGNVGLTFVRAGGERNPTITGERQNLWALDGAYKIVEALSVFGLWGHTDYTRTTGSFRDHVWVGGARVAGPRKSELKLQYQRVGEDYDLLGNHKNEHYPSNFQGWHASATVPVTPAATLRGLVYQFHQLETATNADDTVFGDPWFPSLANSARGHVSAWRLAADYDFGKHEAYLPKLEVYYEHAQFRKNAPDGATSNDIDKRVQNLNLQVTQPLCKGVTLDLGVRRMIATGRWQAMRFHHRQDIPEVGLTYTRGETLHAMLLYHWYDFVDSIDVASGRNNYRVQQLLCEVRWTF